jgi:hypothetical protein
MMKIWSMQYGQVIVGQADRWACQMAETPHTMVVFWRLGVVEKWLEKLDSVNS